MLQQWGQWRRRFFVSGLALAGGTVLLWVASFWQLSLRSGETAIGVGSGAVHFARGDYDARFPWHLNICSKTHWFSGGTLIIWNRRPIWQRQDRWHWQHGGGYWWLQVPFYLLISAGVAICGATYAGERWHRRRCARLVICVRCGYDLRASTERCPECGTAIAAQVRTAP